MTRKKHLVTIKFACVYKRSFLLVTKTRQLLIQSSNRNDKITALDVIRMSLLLTLS